MIANMPNFADLSDAPRLVAAAPGARRPAARAWRRWLPPLVLSALAACAVPPAAPPAPPPPSELGNDRAIPLAAIQALRERFPTLHVVSRATGKFQVDDVDDLAVVMAPIGEKGNYVIALLSNVGPDRYKVTKSSVVLNPGCALCSASVNIVEHSLFVHVIQAEGADYANVTYQFAYRDNDDQPRLIGVTTYQPEQTDDPIPHSYSNSANLLTGRKIDEIDDSDNDQPRHREVMSTVPLRAPILFDRFSFAPDALAPETRHLPVSAFDLGDPLPPRAQKLLAARFPGMTVQAKTVGALRGAGGHDIAVVLGAGPTSTRAGSGATTALAPTRPVVAVLLAQPNGDLQLADSSPAIGAGCDGCEIQLLIARRSLTVQLTHSDRGASDTRAYQFAYRPGEASGRQMRLIGVRTESVTHGPRGSTRRYVNSTNLLNGDKIDGITDVVDGHPVHLEQKSRVQLRPPVLLASFGFDPAALRPETRRDFSLPATAATAAAPAPHPAATASATPASAVAAD